MKSDPPAAFGPLTDPKKAVGQTADDSRAVALCQGIKVKMAGFMATPIELFDYDLPKPFIAQQSVEPRDHAKLLVLDRATGTTQHRQVLDLPALLRSGDVLVFNQTKVFKSRLRLANGMELFLLREREPRVWQALIRSGKKAAVGATLLSPVGLIRVKEKLQDGTWVVEVEKTREDVLRLCEQFGEVPIPPYVEKSAHAEQTYQTIYAKQVGAVAAPTAGFHFTERLLQELKAKGVQMEFITLHVGIGTFRPVQTETLEEHTMHAEFVEIDPGTAERLAIAKGEKRRVIAVGTTVVRALEATGGSAYTGDVNIFITPGYTFQVVDGLITNFHLPKSTLLVLVSAFVGREKILAAYEEAKKNHYRFYSFGDAMFIGDRGDSIQANGSC